MIYRQINDHKCENILLHARNGSKPINADWFEKDLPLCPVSRTGCFCRGCS